MGDTFLFAPQVRPVQPAFIQGNSINIYFSLNADIDSQVSAIGYKIIDPSKSATDGINVIEESQLSKNLLNKSDITGEYYFSIADSSALSLSSNHFYQLQIKQIADSNNESTWSQISLIKQLAENITVRLENVEASGNEISLSPFDNLILSGEISQGNILKYCAFTSNGKTVIGNISGYQFDIPMKDFFKNNAINKIEGTLILETTDSYEYSQAYTVILNEVKVEDANIISLELDYAAGGILVKDIPENTKYLVRRPIGNTIWDTIAELKVNTFQWLDCTIEGGMVYEYRALDANKESIAHSFDSIETDFEDIFLSDSDTMIVIRYNSSISGLKYISQEAITNTLGGKYPIIRKNGDTKYKQFSISGMLYLDYCLDEGCLYYTGKPFALEQVENSSARAKEKILRQIAESFLTNGQPKIFRSYDEGPMIVHISNVSFTPNKQLNNHIYDFSAQVTEICEFSSENLKKYKFNLASFQKYFLNAD